MKFIRKALWPTAIVAAALMLFGALGSAINAAEEVGAVETSGDLEIDEEVGVHIVISDSNAADVQAIKDAVQNVKAAQNQRAVGDAEEALRKLLDKLGQANSELAISGVSIIDDAHASGLLAEVDTLVTTLTEAIDALNTPGGVLAEERKAANDAVAAFSIIYPLFAPADYNVRIDNESGRASIVGVLVGTAIAKQSPPTRSVGASAVNLGTLSGSQSQALASYALPNSGWVVLVLVECSRAGEVEIEFDSTTDGIASKFTDLTCGAAAAPAAVASTAVDASISVSGTTVSVDVADRDDDAASGVDVEFTTDRCEFANGSNAQAVDTDSAGTAEATLTCATPGTATVTASVDRPGRDLVLVAMITVVGAPDTLSVEARSMMDDMACGDVVTLTITVIDSAGQAVADGTVVQLSTNVGGSLVSSVTTVNGAAKAFLITSDTNDSYAVVAQSGAATGYATVTCDDMSMDDDAVAPPITPPSTGDAGLAN